MGFRDLVTIDQSIELDTSNLDQRLDELQSAIDEVSGMDESKVQDLIDSTIDGRNLVSTDDVDVESLERRVSDVEEFEGRIGALENDSVDTQSLHAFEQRISVLEERTDDEKSIESLAERLSDLERVNEQAVQVFNALVQVVGILIDARKA